MGRRSLQNRTGKRLLRRSPACVESRRSPRSLERRRNFAVSYYVFNFSSHLLINYFSVIGVPSSTAYILAYDHLLNVVLPPFIRSETGVPLIAGVLARSAIASIASPLELIRTNLQSTPLSPENPHTLRSVLSSIRTLIRTNGFQVMWRGLGPTLWRDVPFSGFYWASYEKWKRAFAKRGHEGARVAFINGAISGTSAALITSPFDVLKTRRQALIMSSSLTDKGSSTFRLLLQIFRTEGPSAFFAGIIPRIAKIAPACGILIASFEVYFYFRLFLLTFMLIYILLGCR